MGVREARPSLLSVLVEAGVASEEQLRLALAEGMGTGERLGEVVLRKGWIDQDGLGRLLAAQWRLPFVEDEAVEFAGGVAGVALGRVRELGGCVLGQEEGVPLVVVAEPATERLNKLRALLGGEVAFSVVSVSTLARLQAEVGSDEAEVGAGGEGAAAVIEAAEASAAHTEQLVAELDAATAGLAGLRERVGQLSAARAAAEAALVQAREQVAALEQQHADRQARERELEQQHAQAHEQLTSLKAGLVELLQALDESQ